MTASHRAGDPLDAEHTYQNAAGEGAAGFRFACPACRTPLTTVGPDGRRCPRDGRRYRRDSGIWHFLLPKRAVHFARFMEHYALVRREEGRGAEKPGFYRALPFEDRSGNHRGEWRVRTTSFRALLQRVVAPLEGERNRPVRTLDLGAGNGWLSYRLAERGHQVAAVDLLTDNRDGLGTHTLYPVGYTPIQAEFDRLPLDDGQADLAVFNASLHYSRDYEVTLSEALRVLRDEGTLVILDSPVYRQRRSGEKMIEERGRSFETRYGFRSGSPPGEGFLTFNRLDQLSNRLGVEWQTLKPFYGLGWTAKRWRELVFGSREPATFMLIVGGRR